MFELLLFVGGMMVAWALLAVFCAERQRRLMAIQDQIERERYTAEEAQRKAQHSVTERGDVTVVTEATGLQPPKAKAA